MPQNIITYNVVAELPDIEPPACAYVRDEDDYYWKFPSGWRKVDNSFLWTNEYEVPMIESTMNYDRLVVNHWERYSAPHRTTTAPDGKIVYDSGQLFCVHGGLGIQVLREGTPGIHIQDAAPRRNFHEWHPEPLGFVICNGGKKGDMKLSCSVTPQSVATKINSPCKMMEFTTPGYEPDHCVQIPQGYGLPFKYSNEMWLTSPWPYIDIPLQDASPLTGGSWPEGLGRTLTFADPIPMPVVVGSCFFNEENDWFIPPVYPGFGWITTGEYLGTIGATSIGVRMFVGPSEYTLYGHQPGATVIDLFKPHTLPSPWQHHSNLRGIAAGDYVCFEHNTGMAAERSLHRVVKVSTNISGNPNTLTIAPGLPQGLHNDYGHTNQGYRLGNKCYWIPAVANRLTTRFIGWNDPHGDSGVPIYVKEVKGKTLELLAPLAADIPVNTKMYMWSSVENETMTYSYRDPYTYIYNKAYKQRVANIQGSIDAYNAQVEEELKYYNNAYLKAQSKAHARWFSPPYGVNSNLNEWFPGEGTFHDKFLELHAKRINLRQPRQSDIEYISLLNYRSIL